jgi:hypothetical protein
MDIERQTTKRDVMDMPIRKPSDPLPTIFETIRHSGFTTMRKPGVRNTKGAAGEKRSPTRLPKEN